MSTLLEPAPPNFVRKHAAHAFPQDALDFDQRLVEEFLGSDLTTASIFAVGSKIALLITTAAQPRNKREDVAKTVRGGLLKKIFTAIPEFSSYTSELPADEVAAVHAGEVPLHELDIRFKNWMESRDQAVQRLTVEIKDQLWAVFRSILADNEFCGDHIRPEPRWVVIRGDGEVRFFRHDAAAKEFWRAAGMRSILMPIELQKCRYHSPDRAEVITMLRRRGCEVDAFSAAE